MSGLQYRIVETPTGATASIFVPGRQPMIVQSSHPLFEDIVKAAREGDAGLVAWMVNGGRSGDRPAGVDETWLASRGALSAKPVATCPACSMPVSVAPGDVDKDKLTCPFCSNEWNEFIVPDKIGAIVSWKGLQLHGHDLVSPARPDFKWRPGIAGVAQCRTSHTPPGAGCGCGIYSGKTRVHQIKLGYVNERNGVLAELHLSGRVTVAQIGFKAQFARIGKLIIPEGGDLSRSQHAIDTLSRLWEPIGVPVTVEPLFAAEDRVKWCPACGHPAPDDPRAMECVSCSAFLERG